ncbi:hypothetical protein ACFQT0_23430 [Hymenobacter humi]|uniref:Uncharacterized protein n=1 Tax=Hymenobacter humi TaxID=1411620 RepID=A0ABW2UAW2_9BACT
MLLKATSSLAQSPATPPPRDPDYQQVSVEVPRSISLITDVAKVLLSRDANKDKVQDLIDRRRARSQKGDQSIIITVPKTSSPKRWAWLTDLSSSFETG